MSWNVPSPNAFCGRFDIEITQPDSRSNLACQVSPILSCAEIILSSSHWSFHLSVAFNEALPPPIADSFRLSRRLNPLITRLRQRLKTPLFQRSLSESSRHYGDLTQLQLFTTSASTPSSLEEPAILWFVPLPSNELPIGGANEPKYNFCALQTLPCSCLSSVPTRMLWLIGIRL